MQTRPNQWAWIGRLPPRTVDRVLVGLLLFFGLLTLLDPGPPSAGSWSRSAFPAALR